MYYLNSAGLYSTSYISWQHDTARIAAKRRACLAAATVDWCLLPAGPTAANLQQQHVVAVRWERDRQILYQTWTLRHTKRAELVALMLSLVSLLTPAPLKLRPYGAIQHTHSRLTALVWDYLVVWDYPSELVPERYQSGTTWILLKQEIVSGSGISWAIWKSAPCSRQITTSAPHHSVFTGRVPFLPPNQQRQALKHPPQHSDFSKKFHQVGPCVYVYRCVQQSYKTARSSCQHRAS